MTKVKVFSGIRPSGKLHLGNYLGAIKNWIELQSKADQAIFAVVDYHGITTPYDPKTYQRQIMDVVLDYLALGVGSSGGALAHPGNSVAGVDPNKALLIRQSKVPQHTELAWLFNTITPISWLDRLPTYREKLEQVKEYSGIQDIARQESTAEEWTDERSLLHRAERGFTQYIDRAKYYQNTTGLLDYPVLMAADILIYKSNLVPVGEDQMPHIDITNEIGKRFNSMFGEIFGKVEPFPQPFGCLKTLTVQEKVIKTFRDKAEGIRIMSLQDPTKKMSKTGDEGIALSDDPDTIRAKIKKAVTDSGKEVKYDEQSKPAISNLLTIYHLLSGKEVSDLEKEYDGRSYVDFKNDLAEVVVNFLEPFQARRKEFEKSPKKVLEILETSEAKARQLADQTLQEVKEKMGLL